MSFDWLALDTGLTLDFSLTVPGLIVALAYAALTAYTLYRARHDFAHWTPARVAVVALLILLAPLFALAVRLHIPINIPFSAQLIAIPLVALLPLLAAAVWLGTGPAIIVGLVIGLTGSLTGTARLTQPFEVALLGVAVGAMLNQPYRGVPARWLRQPLVANLLGVAFVWWPLTLIGLLVTGDSPGLTSLERTLGALLPTLVACLASGLLAGILIQVVVIGCPRWRLVQEEHLQAAPWNRHLSHRILYTLVPLSLLAILVLVSVVAATSFQVATRLVIEQMARDAENTSSNVPYFFQVGRSLIKDLATDTSLGEMSQPDLQMHLGTRMRAVPFFERLVYFDATGQVSASHPALEVASSLSQAERDAVDLALRQRFPSEVTVFASPAGQDTAVSFVEPVVEPGSDRVIGALVGSTTLGETNPVLAPVVDILNTGFVGSGEGLLVDSQNRILLYPANERRQQAGFALGDVVEIPFASHEGQAFRQREADGSYTLIYRLPIEGHSEWSVLVMVPNQVALALAAQIALPMLLLLVIMAGVAFPLIVAVLSRITTPLGQLLTAVDALGHGELSEPVQVAGEDEIGRLGEAFEQMRVRLSARLDELERLLRVSRSVASSLDLFRSVPPILSSALEVTNALGVRMVVRQGSREPLQTYAAGEVASVMTPLDEQLLELVERQGTVVISQLWRASGSLDTTALPPRIQALMALPLRSDTSFHGILWLAYDHEHDFEQSEMTFLATLAGQAAIAVSNARLFSEAQEERRKLEAVLESTADAMIVVDSQGRLVLINPSGEKYLGVRAEEVSGKPAEQVIEPVELARLLTNLQEPVSVQEMPGLRGKALLASVSTMVSHDGTLAGRVAVMRDITALKELDNIKTVFLRMVSHDLRSPLTYMRGYLSMLPLTGDLNERQTEALQKISNGIDSISDLTERLLYLSRLQFGESAQLDFTMVDVETLIKEIALEQETAIHQRSVTLRLDSEGRLPLLAADEMMYRQALSNLITNALKYTPEGGVVTIRAFQVSENGESQLTVSVSDNGIGIREEDQPRLFEAFYRVPQREGEPQRPRGSGLGLALVKAIATAHGGTVGMRSVFGQGSTFHITLPVRGAEDIE